MVVEGFLWVTARFPSVRRTLWRGFYGAVATYFRRAEYWTLMNYGYVDDDPAALPQLGSADWPERYPIYLYHRVAARVDLRNRDVLEVGSGRGGGASYVKRYLGARHVLGVDIATSAITFCRRVHRVEGLEFRQGDAQALPVPDSSFDAVLNVESAHCYPSIDRFFSEVRRVLRPGGHLLYADIHGADEVPELERAIGASGLKQVEHGDISAGVVAALQLDSDRRKRWCAESAPRFVHGPFDKFTGVAGTRVPVELANGGERYLTYVLRKPD